MAEEGISASETAKRLEVPIRTVYDYLSYRRLRGEKKGGRWVIDPESLREKITISGGLSGKFLPGEEEFVAWITQKKQEKEGQKP